ncbi:MAG: sigma-70 family RNA polymerase sigma factor [Verrucomicrobiota bacterium]
MPDSTEAQIIAKIRNGNVAAFGLLIERHQRLLYYSVLGKVREHAEAQDIVQKSFVTAYQSLATLTDPDAFFPWLKGIALNHCRNEWRRHYSYATMKERLIEARRAEMNLHRFEQESADTSQRVHALRQCLERLGPEEQSLIELRFVQERSMEQIGEELSKGAEAVRVWLYRVRARLAECVKRRLNLEQRGETA